MPVQNLPDPEGIRDYPGGPVTDDEARREAERCALERAKAITKVKGAQRRSDLFTPSIVGELAFGTVGLMLADVLTGEIKPKDAKQAIDIARIALDISDRTVGSSMMVVGAAADDSPADRAAKIERADTLLTEIRKRARDVVDEARAADGLGPIDLSEYDFGEDDEGPDTPRLRVVESA